MPQISLVNVFWELTNIRSEKINSRLRDIAASPYFVLRCTMDHMKRIVMASSALATWKIINTAFKDTTKQTFYGVVVTSQSYSCSSSDWPNYPSDQHSLETKTQAMLLNLNTASVTSHWSTVVFIDMEFLRPKLCRLPYKMCIHARKVTVNVQEECSRNHRSHFKAVELRSMANEKYAVSQQFCKSILRRQFARLCKDFL